MENRVAVITGFYKSTEFIKVLFQYLNQQTYKNFDVYIYHYNDVESDLILGIDFNCQFIYLDKNAGFAGGNNAAIKAAKAIFNYEYYALINDDTKPESSWLYNLVDLAKGDSKIGVVTSKLVYYHKFLKISGEISKSGAIRKREKVGRLYLNTKFEDTYYTKRFFFNGIYNEEEDELYRFRWVSPKFTFALPIEEESLSSSVKLKMFLKVKKNYDNQILKLTIGSLSLAPIILSSDKVYYEIELPTETIIRHSTYIIQNAGSAIDDSYNGYDIGSGLIDSEEFNTKKSVLMFCGGACLIKRVVFEKVGIFEESFFSYYEDSDLSHRIKKAGYDIIYNPKSTVMHYHSGTSIEWSPFFTYHVFRNKIIFAYYNYGFLPFVKSFNERLKETWNFFKIAAKRKFCDIDINTRLKLNLVILKDSIIGVIKYSPTKF